MSEVIDYNSQIESIESTRKVAIGIDLVAIGVSLGANVAEAPKTFAGILVAFVAPAFLALCVWAWHLGHGVLSGKTGGAFTFVLGVIALGCGWVSFGHITHVAENQGQTAEAAIAIALIIDATAVLMALLVVACDNKVKAMTEAGQAQTDRLEAEAKAKAEEEEREAEAAAERAAKKAKRQQAKAGKPALTDEAFIAAVQADPEATNAALAERFGSTARTIQRRRAKLNGSAVAA